MDTVVDYEDVEINEENDGETENKRKKDKTEFPAMSKTSGMRNKLMRSEVYQKERLEKQKLKRLARKERRKEGVPKQIPHTIESLRIKDDTTVGDINSEENELVRDELECDEFSEYYKQSYVPKVLITFSGNSPAQRSRFFGNELTKVIPNAVAKHRKNCAIKKIVKSAVREGFSDVMIINDNNRTPNGLLVIHLPDGPTANFRLSNVRLTNEMRRNYKDITKHKPEIILQNFSTRLGLTIGRMLGSLFHWRPQFEGQRAVAFHNQRDYIFFRHYKYDFDEEGNRTKLRELGPRFTLKLRSLQKGTFNTKTGEYVWIIEGKRHEVQSSRRKFFM